MQLSDFYESMAGFTPVNAEIPAAPVAPNPTTQVSPYLRTTLPLPLQYSPDTLRQYNRPGLSSFRNPPLPPSGISALVAAAQSTAIATVASIPSSGTGTEPTLNVPIELTPTTQTGFDLTIAWAPELSGSIFSGPINGGVTGLDSVTNNGNANSTSISVSDTPNNPGVAALLLMNLSGSQTPVLDQFSPNPGAGWTALDTGVGGQFASLYTKYIPTPALVNPSVTLATGCAWTACLMMLGTTAAAVPVIRQQVSLGSGSTANGTTGVNNTQSFSSPTLAGSLILVIMNEGGGSGGVTDSFVIASVSDTQSNNFLKIAGSQAGTGGASPSTFQSQSIVFAAFDTPGGADTVTMNVKASEPNGGGGFFTATFACTAYEITGLGPISGIPSFKQASTLGLQPITFQTNGIKNGSQNILNLVEGTGATIVDDGSGDIIIASDPPFSSITSGTSTSAVTMVVGSTSSLGHAGTGTIDSTSINGVTITGGPSAGQVPTATGSATATWQTPPAVAAFQNLQKRSFLAVDLTTTTLQGLGDDIGSPFGVAGSGNVTAAPTSSLGPTVQLAQSASGSAVGWCAQLNYRTGRNIKLLTEIGLLRTTDIRAYAGLTTKISAVSFGNSDNPATGTNHESYACFRFSTVAGDTVWQAVTGNGTAQTVTSTGVTPDTNGHKFAIIFTDSIPNITFYIDGVLVATVTGTPPAANKNLAYTLTYNGITVVTNTAFTSAIIDCDL